MKKIKIAGVEFEPTVMTFNALCVMEESGAPLDAWDRLEMSILRGYLAACLDTDAKTAGALLEEHITGGGDLSELGAAFRAATEESDFFAALRNRATAAEEEE